MQCDAGVSVDDEEIEVVEHFKYIGSLKSADGNCSKDTISRIGMAKKRMLDLVPIWKDRGIAKDMKMKLVLSLVWTVLTYGAEGWTLTKADEKRIQSAELWIHRRMLRGSWTEHRTDDSILTELGTTRQLLGFVVVHRKLSFFGHSIRDGGCELVKCVIQGKVSGKRRRGRPKTSYSSNITKWTSVNTERITRETRDRAGWIKLIRCAARAADHHSWWDRERRGMAFVICFVLYPRCLRQWIVSSRGNGFLFWKTEHGVSMWVSTGLISSALPDCFVYYTP